MRVFLIGQKWLGAEVLELLRRRGYDVVGCCAPDGEPVVQGGGRLGGAADAAGPRTAARAAST
ncbi:MAG: hypothetical protein WDO24_16370 [Pseudomonadota bacterium]